MAGGEKGSGPVEAAGCKQGTSPVQAAGGVVWKRDGDERRVAVLQRARYRDRDGSEGDWVLPKGHVDPGESLEQTALREVAEEAGCRARIDGPAVEIRYPVGERTKVVSFFPMHCEQEGPIQDTREVRQLLWLSPQDALERLTYDSEREVLQRIMAR